MRWLPRSFLFIGLLLHIAMLTVVRANLYQECAKYFNPHNYMDHLPSLSLPYIGDVPVPAHHYVAGAGAAIRPSPVVTTKAISIATKYVYRNPVCVKATGKKSVCRPQSPNKNNFEYLVTKEYFINKNHKGKKLQGLDVTLKEDYDEADDDYEDQGMYVESSEEPRPFGKHSGTPTLSVHRLKEMLIEDRLDQLETILPHYTRKRVYETSTITITKVLSNNRVTATLMVKNCIPQGYTMCPPKTKKRKSKVAQLTNSSTEAHFFG